MEKSPVGSIKNRRFIKHLDYNLPIPSAGNAFSCKDEVPGSLKIAVIGNVFCFRRSLAEEMKLNWEVADEVAWECFGEKHGRSDYRGKNVDVYFFRNKEISLASAKQLVSEFIALTLERKKGKGRGRLYAVFIDLSSQYGTLSLWLKTSPFRKSQELVVDEFEVEDRRLLNFSKIYSEYNMLSARKFYKVVEGAIEDLRGEFLKKSIWVGYADHDKPVKWVVKPRVRQP
ncbi:MAG: hypothetical protein L6R28_14560 [Planctomycetes bacterium]|nr:hypothetical protein [Planctomycetota bacterium]